MAMKDLINAFRPLPPANAQSHGSKREPLITPYDDMVSLYATHPEPRTPVALLFDFSSSMDDKLSQLMLGFEEYRKQLSANPFTAERVETAIVTFNTEVRVAQPFALPAEIKPLVIETSGGTHGCKALLRATEMLAARWQDYKAHEIDYTQSVVLTITDCGFQDMHLEPQVKEKIRLLENASNPTERVSFFFVTVDGSDLDKLATLSARQPLPIKAANFVKLFHWLAASVQAVSRSVVGDQVDLPPVDWAKL